MSFPNSAADSAHPPVALDEAALASLRELDDDGSQRTLWRVMAAFEKSLARMLQQLQDQLALGDAHAVFSIAHTLKASAASCGALMLSQVAREVEQRYRPGADRDARAAGELRADITRLTTAGEAALLAVRAMLRH
jgi:HPt (histidine-containing phosphotransfer) domain-containing protein